MNGQSKIFTTRFDTLLPKLNIKLIKPLSCVLNLDLTSSYIRPDISRINFSYALSESLFAAGFCGPIDDVVALGANFVFLAGTGPVPPPRRSAVGTNAVVTAFVLS